MDQIDFQHAYYITLGQGFKYAPFSIKERKMRFDWKSTQLNDIYEGNWDKIRKEIQQEMKKSGKNAANRDFNSLKIIAESTSKDIWVTRFDSMMWWGFCKDGKILEDKISKYRELQDGWSNTDIHGDVLCIVNIGERWSINQKATDVAKTFKFSATRCNIAAKQTLRDLINAKI